MKHGLDQNRFCIEAIGRPSDLMDILHASQRRGIHTCSAGFRRINYLVLLRKYAAAEFSGLLRRSPAQYGLAQTRILARASSRDHAPDVGRVIHGAPWT
jgi:hypothetical protein